MVSSAFSNLHCSVPCVPPSYPTPKNHCFSERTDVTSSFRLSHQRKGASRKNETSLSIESLTKSRDFGNWNPSQCLQKWGLSRVSTFEANWRQWDLKRKGLETINKTKFMSICSQSLIKRHPYLSIKLSGCISPKLRWLIWTQLSTYGEPCRHSAWRAMQTLGLASHVDTWLGEPCRHSAWRTM